MAKQTKGILLAGGTGSRLYPITLGVSKQLLPVYDKPMIYYPLSVLMLAGIQDILLISTPKDLVNYQQVFGNGHQFGINIHYAEQPSPDGIAQAYLLAENFLDGQNSCLILGDNLFYGQDFSHQLSHAKSMENGATLFCYHVNDPQRFGVVELGADQRILSLEEKPPVPKSNYAATGLYFCDYQAVDIAKSLQPSRRGELEIADLLNIYLNQGLLKAQLLGRGFAWLDTGTHDSLLKAGQFVQTIESRQGLKIACLEEIALRNGWIDLIQVETQYQRLRQTSYGDYLHKLLST